MAFILIGSHSCSSSVYLSSSCVQCCRSSVSTHLFSQCRIDVQHKFRAFQKCQSLLCQSRFVSSPQSTHPTPPHTEVGGDLSDGHDFFELTNWNPTLAWNSTLCSLLERNEAWPDLTHFLPNFLFHHFSLSLQFLSPHPSPFLSQPFHGERKACPAVRGPLWQQQPSHQASCISWHNKYRAIKATLHSSPSSRKRASVAPDWSSSITFRRCVRTVSMKKCLRLQSMTQRRCPSRGLGNRISTCLQAPETDYHLIQLHLPLPKGANQSAHTP